MELDFYISKNGRYMMLEDNIYDKALNRYANINEVSFSDLIDIVGENITFLAQDVKSDLKEISSFTRKAAYRVVECFTETDKKLSLMMEYEVKFGGSLLTESVTNPKVIVAETWGWIKEQSLILEWTLNPFNKDFYSGSNWKDVGKSAVNTAKSVGNSVVSGAKAVGNAILHPIDTLKAGWNWIKENGLGALMEKIRDGLYSGIGTAIQIFLQFTGVGNVAVGIVWGCMLVYDLYLAFSGKDFSWMDILFDVLGIISGGAVKVLKGAMKVAGITKSMPMAKGVQTLATNPATKGFMATVGKGIGKVFSMLKQAGNWLAQKLGIKWVSGVMTKAETWLSENLLKPIGNAVGLKSVGNKALSKTTGAPTIGQATRKATAGGAAYKAKSEYIYGPGIEKGQELIGKLTGKGAAGAGAAAPAVASVNTYGLTADELAALA
jgi:hypothetical protein